ncbi:SMR domain-containing protein At5g58720-like isoform X2 [Rutidosis leptorrhynchoides]|uniref:SMR domain-containing protein At5g58720-like isoform X2 n=1 Tax=Rutidosis leptorrhynchoides TaxID=125765 RepID=UPI003A9A31CA
MKHPKKKKRPRPPILKSNPSTGSQNPNPSQIDNQQSRVLNGLTQEIASISIEDDDSASEVVASSTETGSSSSGSSGLSNCDGYNNQVIGGKIGKGSKGNKVIAATGMVSTVIGKDYVPTVVKKRGFDKWKRNSDGVSQEDAEQFLCSMLSDDCELGMDLVKDVLCQCAYDVEKALDILLELTSPSSEPCESGQLHRVNVESEDSRPPLESNDSTSDLASSSEGDIGFSSRNYFDALANIGTDRPPSPKSTSELTQDVLESLFHTKKSSKHEPRNMNWRSVVKKMESFGQMFDYPSEDTEKKQHVFANGEDYQHYRSDASQHWDSMKNYYHKAATAYASGKREYAGYLSDQGRICNEKARNADKRASQDIFNSRNKNIENVITIDLHGQHVKQGMKLLKLHLLFGAYVRCC